MRRLIFTLFAITTSVFLFGQSVSSTYSAGDIPTNYLSYSATCNGAATPLVVALPTGTWEVTTVDVAYDMTAQNWAYMEEQRSKLACQESGTDEGSFISGTGSTTGTFNYSRTGLTFANGTYSGNLTFELQAYRTYGSSPTCGTGYQYVDVGTWTVTVHYQTPATCPAPTADSTDNITKSSAKVYWTENGSATEWQVEYGLDGYTAGTGTKISPTVISSPDTTINGLTANTDYDWYVRSICSVGDTSAWSSGLSFTTLCDAVTTYPWTEDFEAVWVGTPAAPPCWSQITVSGTNVWNRSTTSPHGGTYCAKAPWASAGGEHLLITPELDLGTTTDYRLKFFLKGSSSDGTDLKVQIATSNSSASNFTIDLAFYEASVNMPTSWTEVTIDLSAYENSQFIAFRMIDDDGYSLYIDDVTVEEIPACPIPTADSTTAVTPYAAKMWWTENGTASKWDIIWDTAGFDHLTTGNLVSGIVNEDTTLNPPFVPETDYEWYVRSDCGSETSTWDGPKSFTTLATCPAPTGQTYYNLTANTVELGWTENGGATTWIIEWGPDGFTRGTGTTVQITNNPHELTGLSAITDYDWYVRSYCAAGDSSVWVGPDDFTTECGVYPTTYSQDFNGGYPPECWFEAYGNVPNPAAGSSAWFQDDFANNSSNSLGVKMNVYNTDNDWLISPKSDLGTGGKQISYMVAVTHYNNTNPETMSSDDTVFVIIGQVVSGVLNWDLANAITYYTDSNSPSNTGDAETFALTGWSDTVRVAFYTKGSGTSPDMDIHFDDLVVEDIPACQTPSADSTTNITQTSAKLWWTETGTAAKWDIIWDTAGFDPLVGGNLIQGIVNEDTTLNLFTANKHYDWFVRSDCKGGNISSWSNRKTFHTECGILATFPYTEGFEADYFPPDCWSNPDGLWNHGTEAHSGSYCARVSYSHDGEAILYSPEFNLPADYGITFWWKDDDITARVATHDTTFFELTTNGGTTWIGIDTLSAPSSMSNYVEVYHNLSAYGGNTVQFRWRDLNDTTYLAYGTGVDDITIEQNPTCPDPRNLETSEVSPTTAILEWTETGSATDWIIEYGQNGFTLGTGTIVQTTSNPYQLTGLTANTDYQWYVRSFCAVGDSSNYVGPEAFSTPDMIATFPYNESFETDFGKWVQSTLDDFNWTRDSGGTGSSGTGPSAAQDGTWYLYTEASSPNSPAKTAGLYAYCDFATMTWPQLEFYYNMYGANMGTLYLMVSTDNAEATWDTVWSMTGDQGTDWHQASVGLGSYAGDTIMVKFTGLTGIDFTSDMAIDNVSITNVTDPILSIIPDSVNYGECPLNNLSAEYYTRTFTVQNIGPGTETINNVLLTGGDLTEFQLLDTNTYSKGLSGSATITFEVKFAPTTTGDKATTLRVVTAAKADHDVPLHGSAYVAPPQNLDGETTITYTNDLTWDPPLPENEIRYDNGIVTRFFWVNDPSSDDHYFYTRFTAPVGGDLDHVALFTKKNNPGNNWNEILVCPDNGSGAPNLGGAYVTFSDVEVNSTTGEWILLDLATSAPTLSQGTDFYLVTRWPDTTTLDLGPFVGTDETQDFGRCGWSSDGGMSWLNAGGAFLMRAYMSTAKDGPYKIYAGEASSQLESLETMAINIDENQIQTRKVKKVPVPGIYTDNQNRAFVDYSLHRGTSNGTYSTHYTGITTTSYTDNTGLVNGQQYFYAVTANYSGAQVSDTSNEVSLTVLDIPTAPSNPTPADLATDVLPDADLSWVNNGNVQFIDLYLSQTETDVINKLGTAKVLDNVAVTNTYDPGPMAEADWYWRVVVRDGVATEVDGDVWEFNVSTDPLITYTPLVNTSSTLARTITDTITDFSGIPTSGTGLPVLYWKLNVAGAWKPVTGTSMGSDMYDFSFGGSGVSTGDTVYYYTVAQDAIATPNVIAAPSAGAGGYTASPPAAATPPTNPEFYVILAAMAGNYTVGTVGTEDFASLTNDGGFFETINNNAVSGPITATITTDLTETGTHALNEVFREGGNHIISIEPDIAKAAKTVSGNVSGGLIKLNGADYVEFDGFANQLAYVNEATSGARTFELTNGASHNTIRQCEISTGSNASSTNYCIYSYGAGNDTNSFSLNELTKAYYGIYLYGTSSNNNKRIIINSNTIGADTTLGADTLITKYGIYANYQSDISIHSNKIKYLIYSSVPYGIYLLNSTDVYLYRNYIHDIVYTGSGGYGPLGIYLDLEEDSPGDASTLITNNIIRHIAGDSNVPSWVPAGIRILGGSEITTGIDIYYNSIYLQPDTVYGLGDYESTSTYCAGIIIDDGPTGINLVNNIVYNSIDERADEQPITSYGAAVWCKASASPFATIDNNLYFADTCDNNFVGFSGTANPPTTYDLNAWQAFTGQDHYSLWGDPQFNSTLLGLTDPGSPALGEGIPVAGVTGDYHLNSRHEYFPTIGATEYTAAHIAIWTGNVDTDWNKAGNWLNNAVPTQISNVAIPTDPDSNPDLFPDINGFNAFVKKIIVDTGANLNIFGTGGKLTISQ